MVVEEEGTRKKGADPERPVVDMIEWVTRSSRVTAVTHGRSTPAHSDLDFGS